MPKSARLGLAELLAVHRIAGECRELGDDAPTWRAHLFHEVGRLVDVPLVLGGEMGFSAGRPARSLGVADWGWQNGFDPAGWHAALAEFARDPDYSPVQNALVARGRPADWVGIARRDVLPDADWYGSRYFDMTHAAAGFDDITFCFEPVPGAPAVFSGMLLCRPAGAPGLTARERARVRAAHRAVAGLVGGPLARFADPSPAALPRQARRVLRCLLDGDSDKQAAARLGLSPHTVREYVQHVFRHFGVTGRAELLARWVRRGWGGRAAWADDPPAGPPPAATRAVGASRPAGPGRPA